jgi:hypothetical protein
MAWTRVLEVGPVPSGSCSGGLMPNRVNLPLKNTDLASTSSFGQIKRNWSSQPHLNPDEASQRSSDERQKIAKAEIEKAREESVSH